MSLSPPRNHHFVPVFYLRRWARDDGKLYEWTMRDRTVFRRLVHPKATGFQRDLYTVHELPEASRQWFEQVFLQQTDDLAAKAIAALLAGKTLDAIKLSGFSRFLMTLGQRHPDGLPELVAAINRLWNYKGQLPEYEMARQPGDPSTYQEFLATLAPETRAQVQVNILKACMDNEIVGKRLNSMVWAVLNLADSGISLLTSDWPVELGLRPGRSLISLPISPREAILGSESEDFLRAIGKRRPLEIVKVINKFVVSHARLFVYSNDESQRSFIAKWMGRNQLQSPLFPALAKLFTLN